MTGTKFVVAVTDENWFDMLRQQPDLREVNFWAPSTASFEALDPGELVLFKLRKTNFIVGCGVFDSQHVLSCALAWEAFGEANGAHTAQELRNLIMGKRSSSQGDFEIRCRILIQPFFFEERDWIPVPASWKRQTVRYKKYHTGEAEGLALWETIIEQVSRQNFFDTVEESARFGKPCLTQSRLGQGAFRVLVTDIYQRRCAVTRERTLPALEAAHIRPYGDGGTHEAPNGLLLRSDIHNLFDTGYVTVTPDLQFKVSRQIKEKYENGRNYYALQDQLIHVPQEIAQRPDPEALNWHNENCYRRP